MRTQTSHVEILLLNKKYMNVYEDISLIDTSFISAMTLNSLDCCTKNRTVWNIGLLV